MDEEIDETEECGWSTDHDERLIYEDDDIEQRECRRCGAEWFIDKTDRKVLDQ